MLKPMIRKHHVATGTLDGEEVTALVHDLNEFINSDADAEIIVYSESEYGQAASSCKKNQVTWVSIENS